ncbi:hypothetical protein G7Z17_g8930 [Cylindrodendrum hubeiense]|uniref:Potassium channel domain-containing protein n=1 Tax=Cylindrodendrum hubeiense TaxID=595255 RepID=A0A9P5L8K8_9HYPO|nr:hypothetical protein G7Z17_g8930 [Cylindrodendrum hubeiense]
MDDAGLGDIIENEAEIVESCTTREKKFSNDDAHLEPTRWWFASSAFPMIAGTLGPVASAFSICALVRPWRQHLPPGTDVQDAYYINDPAWLTIVNAIQLVVALVSNMFLLLNMARRVRFIVAQPITIIGWYISAMCLIILNATAAGPLRSQIKFPVEELIWSQAFFYGIWAAILYFLDASLMVVTFYGAWTNHYDKDFMLTPSQRTLMLQTIMFLVYLLLGALVFSNIEGWDYLDSVYWADVTLFTVGFGDYSASTPLGRALMMPYALVGVISLGLVIGSIRSLVLDRGKRRLDARMEEKKRRKLVRTMTLHGKDDILEPIRSDSGLSHAPRSANLPSTEFERRKAEFGLMRQIQAQSSSRRRWMAMAISTGSWLVLWLVGALIFLKCEQPYQNWTYFDGFYFCFVTLTTIGYGDVTPVSNAGKSFFVFWSLLALPTMTVLISNAGDTVVKFVRDGTLRLGNVTILPGEEDFFNNYKHIIQKITFGKVFPSHVMPEPKPLKPTIGSHYPLFSPMAKSEEHSLQDDARGRARHFDIEHEAGVHHRPEQDRALSTFTARVRRSLSRLRDPLDDLPTGTDFHFLLVSEIQVVTSHLKESKPHRYSFDEWAWYLKLIGEDERSAETHGKARPKEKHKHHHYHRGHHGGNSNSHDNENDDGNRKSHDHDHDHDKDHDHDHNHGHDHDHNHDHVHRENEYEGATWSWVGNRSPLMGSQEESEWILDRLTDRLRESLSAERRRQLRMPVRGFEPHHFQPHAPHHHWDTQHHSSNDVHPDEGIKKDL